MRRNEALGRSRRRAWVSLAALLVVTALAGTLVASGGHAASASPPVNTAPPTISGTPQDGQTLTSSTGTYSGTAPFTYIYQWSRCDQNGANCVHAGGTTTQKTYLVVTRDVGHTLRVDVTASNSSGNTTSTSVPTAVIRSSATPPKNTAPPTISGTPQDGQVLTAAPGTYSGSAPLTYVYQWQRCDTRGGHCVNASGTTTQTGYRVGSLDVGYTLRVTVAATNKAGSTTTTSAPTAVVQRPPVTNGCPSGAGTIDVARLSLPARLVIDGQQAQPTVLTRSTSDLVLRFHVSACGGRSVQGVLVYVTAVPFEQFTVPPEVVTGSDGWAITTMHRGARFPASSRQQLLAVFVRARKSGENVLGGISTRQLVSFRVHL